MLDFNETWWIGCNTNIDVSVKKGKITKWLILLPCKNYSSMVGWFFGQFYWGIIWIQQNSPIYNIQFNGFWQLYITTTAWYRTFLHLTTLCHFIVNASDFYHSSSALFRSSYKQIHTACTPLWLASFTWQDAFELHPCCMPCY